MAVRRTHFSMCTSFNIRYFKSSLETAKLFLTPGTPGTSSLVNYQQTFTVTVKVYPQSSSSLKYQTSWIRKC